MQAKALGHKLDPIISHTDNECAITLVLDSNTNMISKTAQEIGIRQEQDTSKKT